MIEKHVRTCFINYDASHWEMYTRNEAAMQRVRDCHGDSFFRAVDVKLEESYGL